MKAVEITRSARRASRLIATGLVVMMVLCVIPVSALTVLPHWHSFASVANDAGVKYNLDSTEYGGPNNTYYMKFDGGGLNALHITTDTGVPNGQVTNSTLATGTFYVSDTGGRGYDDDIILMFATNATLSSDFSIEINASGYQWEATTEEPTSHAYQAGALQETFWQGDFVYGPQIYKPCNVSNYPIFYGQNMADTENTFQIMFIDLNVGVLGLNSTLEGNGMAQVDYKIGNFTGFGAFDANAWCLHSNQGQGISWTNRVEGTGSSGYTVSIS
ncbi:nitroreductase [Methanoculleus sp. UBA303]|uniref:nitroreductase n=1 Tax=Methanoculleus sp. UBA303 TaxID=1915497 RepID=UPI0025EA4A04|nr:nitroreductase [Methanoculleus sp. UBA303]MDD3933308.1 nitroreductase [Methanoculleus sp.]